MEFIRTDVCASNRVPFKECTVKKEKWLKTTISNEEYWAKEYIIINKFDYITTYMFDIKDISSNKISRIKVDLTTYYGYNVNDNVFIDYDFDIVPVQIEDIAVKNVEPVVNNTIIQTNNSIETNLINKIDTTQKIIDDNIVAKNSMWSMFIGFSVIVVISVIIGIFACIYGDTVGPVVCFSVAILFTLLILIPLSQIINLTKNNKELNSRLNGCRAQLEKLKQSEKN